MHFLLIYCSHLSPHNNARHGHSRYGQHAVQCPGHNFREFNGSGCNWHLNTLLETSGDPTDWEQSGKVNVAGLATYDSILGPLEGTIDTNKLIALKASDVSNITGVQYGFLLNITSLKTGTNIKSLNNSDINTAKNVFKVERVALYSNLKIVSSAKKFNEI